MTGVAITVEDTLHTSTTAVVKYRKCNTVKAVVMASKPVRKDIKVA